jgi:hypothetical protein
MVPTRFIGEVKERSAWICFTRVAVYHQGYAS